MAIERTNIAVADAAAAPRTGPIGRVARLLLAAGVIWSGYELWFDRDLILAEWDEGLLILTGLVVYGLRQIAVVFDRGPLAVALLAAGLMAASAWAILWEGSLWAPPLSWLVWGVDFGFLVVLSALLLVATVAGTPGCEIGVIGEVTRRLRRQTHQAEAMFCLVGLHKLDDWEARKAQRRPAP